MLRLMLLAAAVACVLAAAKTTRDPDEASCPPARFIACGDEPSPNVCLNGIVGPTGTTQCCWIVDADGELLQHLWTTEFVADPGSGIGMLPLQFGMSDDNPVMSAEFNTLTRVASMLKCYYYVTSGCGQRGTAGPIHVLTLTATEPTRFAVSPAVARHTERETSGDPSEFVCECEHKDALPLPERYRCCYWESDIPEDAASSSFTRLTECFAPRARADPELDDCRRIVRPVSSCGDAGACYCRFEYSQSVSGATRDPWGCGQCCPALTNDFGRDLISHNNDTRAACLLNTYPFTQYSDGSCGDERLSRRAAQLTSAATRVTAGLLTILVLVAFAS